ncbi:hypothetical protein E2C01_087579 [Portunus trituberculatus]|uniref:Uncharacterized protein n=1 Tax=Portunus trituberculatus TaxID=210409 RepID=A0A5B7JHP2_PORTR|nr:hypothetical protein [Portunus trituberculatus]
MLSLPPFPSSLPSHFLWLKASRPLTDPSSRPLADPFFPSLGLPTSPSRSLAVKRVALQALGSAFRVLELECKGGRHLSVPKYPAVEERRLPVILLRW